MIKEIDGIKIYSLPNKMYDRYRFQTDGNLNTDYNTAKLKLSRNIALSKLLYEEGSQKLWLYGSLKIRTNEHKDRITITGIWGNCEEDSTGEWFLHTKKFNKYNKRLGLYSNKFI